MKRVMGQGMPTPGDEAPLIVSYPEGLFHPLTEEEEMMLFVEGLGSMDVLQENAL